MRYQRAEHPLRLDGLAAAQAFFRGCLAESEASRETLWVAHIDERAHCLHISRHDGDQNDAPFPLRQIMVDAVQHGSAGILLAHNHPSGDARPSESDRRATRRLASAAEALDCTVVDHLVFAGADCTSFRSLGLL